MGAYLVCPECGIICGWDGGKDPDPVASGPDGWLPWDCIMDELPCLECWDEE